MKIISDQRGYGLVEALIMLACVGVIACAVLSIIYPEFQALHAKASEHLREIGGSGI
ncbi:MAG TPA: hypothetical protein PK728_04970 [Bacillota bacterium]|nr:hypothetical protein [Bacillota bacterium]